MLLKFYQRHLFELNINYFVVVIINEAFCKTTCLNNARRVQGSLEVPDIELNERKPSNII